MLGLYCRVSTDDQNPKIQIDALKEYATKQQMAYELFVDYECGKNDSRKEFDRLREKIELGTVREVAVYKIDRYFRSTLGGLSFLKLLVEEKKGRLTSVAEGIDTTTPIGMMMITWLLSFAEFEIHQLKERQSKGIERVRKENDGKCPWGGWQKGKPKKLFPLMIESIAKARQQGASINKICRDFGVTIRTVYRAFEKYEKDFKLLNEVERLEKT